MKRGNVRKLWPPLVRLLAMWALALLIWVLPVSADDCFRDPLNANDCLRTPGTAQALATIATLVTSILVNGQQILQTILQAQQGGGIPGGTTPDLGGTPGEGGVQWDQLPPDMQGLQDLIQQITPDGPLEVGGTPASGMGIGELLQTTLTGETSGIWDQLNSWLYPTSGNTATTSDWVKDAWDLLNNIQGTDQGTQLIQSLVNQLTGADDAVNTFRDVLKNTTVVGPGGMVQRTGWTKYTQALQNMLGKTGLATQIMSGIGKGFKFGSILADTLSNMEPRVTDDGRYIEGDSIPYALTKATASAELMGYIGKKNPGLAVMELVNFVGFGGSKASDIISPGKTIGGTFNALCDLVTDQIQGTDTVYDAAQAGKYGGAVKSLTGAAALGGEALGDPQQFAGDWSNVVTDDQFYQNMYDSSYDLWKPPPGAGTFKRTLCATGELATDAAIKAAELTAKGAQWAGDATQRTINWVRSWF